MLIKSGVPQQSGLQNNTVRDTFLFVGVFIGVSLVAWSLLDFTSTFWLMILGLILSPISLMLYNKGKGSITNTIKQKYLKSFIVYLTSTLGIGLIEGSIISFDENHQIFTTLIFVGSVLSLISRYNFKKQALLGIIEDFILYFLIHTGIVILVFSIFKMTSSPTLAITLFLLSVLVTPYLLLSRERAISRKKYSLPLRKYLSTMAVVTGLGGSLLGIISLLTGAWLLVLISGVAILFLLGGLLLDSEHSLVNIKDIL